MDIKVLMETVEKFLNNEVSSVDLDYSGTNRKQQYFLNTVKRLVKAHNLYQKDKDYKSDYILAIRDYLITFDTSIKIVKDYFLSDNNFGISFDNVEKKYFATYQLPESINEKFVKEVFLKEISSDVSKGDGVLATDSAIFKLTGYSSFKSLEQKIAVYGALNTPDGYTTLISLPTGGGKSLVTQTISYQKDGLTIVVVPTVSLAIDQDRVTKAAIKRAYNEDEVFYYSSDVDASPILKAIKTKVAKILFISPEALLENSAFANAIKDANQKRYLKNIVIDEAHILVDWGAFFRVDYQCLESWRNMLLKFNPALRTILLSATFEDKCVDILKKFFEVEGRWIEIRCDALRHEPRYCVVYSKDYNDKKKTILELVRKLPHPMIIYVARPSEADEIKRVLSVEGIKNIRTFTGLTRKMQRKKLIEEWVENEYEIMIATSAFGVGVDKSDVRTVIHTYIPQNANTYYQELGRGGRDGLPCLSVMCLQPRDIKTGKERISKKVLTSEKIMGRWDSMYNNSKSIRLSENRVFIDTSIKPNYTEVDEFDDSPTSETDMNWNIYVLLFLRRYDMIKILEVKIENGKYKLLIRIEDDRLLVIDNKLTDYIEKIREKEWNYYNSSYISISSAFLPNYKDCISELFADTYSKVYEFCGGCNAHNEIRVGDAHKFSLKNKVEMPLREISEEQVSPFGSSNELIVLCRRDERAKLIEKLVVKGVSLIVVPDDFCEDMSILQYRAEKNVLILGVDEVYQLIRKKSWFFISGVVAVLYPDYEKDIGKQFVVIKNNLCNKKWTKVIHIIEKNVYISQAGKNIIELVDGPNFQSDVIYS